MWLQDILVFWSPRFQDNQDTQGAVETHNLLTSTGKGWNEAFLRKKSSASWNLTSHEIRAKHLNQKKVMCIIPNVDGFPRTRESPFIFTDFSKWVRHDFLPRNPW